MYLCSRSLERGQAAADDIKTATGAGDDKLVVMQLDLGSTKSIRRFASDFLKRTDFSLLTLLKVSLLY